MARLGDLADYKVADDEVDARGWHVLTREGIRAGEVTDLIVDLVALRVCYLDVELDRDALRLRGARHVLVPTAAARLNDDEEIVRLGVTASELIAAPAYDPESFSEADRDVLRRRYARYLTRSAADLALGARRRIVGDVELRQPGERAQTGDAARKRTDASKREAMRPQ